MVKRWQVEDVEGEAPMSKTAFERACAVFRASLKRARARRLICEQQQRIGAIV